jgi:hypothetical protein
MLNSPTLPHLLHGRLYLIVVLFAVFPYTDVFPEQLMKHYLIICAVFPFHASQTMST